MFLADLQISELPISSTVCKHVDHEHLFKEASSDVRIRLSSAECFSVSPMSSLIAFGRTGKHIIVLGQALQININIYIVFKSLVF